MIKIGRKDALDGEEAGSDQVSEPGSGHVGVEVPVSGPDAGIGEVGLRLERRGLSKE